MSNFRIIAIKTGSNGISPRNFLKSSKYGVDIDYLKNLSPNTVYSFYNNYTFPSNDFSRIEYNSKNEISLYSIKLSNGRNIQLNINAIVGENGTGKSTLIELIYWMNYNLGCKFGLLKTYKDEDYLINNLLDLEMLYQVNDNLYYILKFNGTNIDQLEVKYNGNNFELPQKPDWKTVTQITDIPDFFYSIVVNYSQYALNALEVGEWINPLFHKNDGYQTPIVLNPMRNDGNININKEKLLLSRRLQSNVLEKIAIGTNIEDSLRNLSNGKIAKIFNVEYNEGYFEEIYKNQEAIKQELYDDILLGLKIHFNVNTDKGDSKYQYFGNKIIQYIYYKLNKVVIKYPTYSDFRDGKSIKNIEVLLGKMKNSNSHMAFKIKGALLHLKYYDLIYKNSIFNLDNPFDIDIEDFSNIIYKQIIPNEPFFVNTFMMAMPSFFYVEIMPDKNLSISNFSSGEKQKIFSLSSIVYHLINLNSVEKSGFDFTNYKYINIILDEIEMYYHPEWQRKYINDFIEYISKINPDNLKQIEGINITFLTHSPFILSDIPKQNTLLLKVENNLSITKTSKEQTFGSNIHDLLLDNFFMTSTIGEYSKRKINEFVKTLNDLIKNRKNNKPRLLIKSIIELEKLGGENFIELIGDSLVRDKVHQLYCLATEKSDKDGLKKYYETKLNVLNN